MSDDGDGREGEKTEGADRTKRGERNPLRLFEVFADPRRRRILYSLSRRDEETTTTDELTKRVAAQETGYRPETLVEAEYADVRRALRDDHLPRLHDEGIIDFDPRSGTVRLRRLSRAFLLALSVSRLVDRTR